MSGLAASRIWLASLFLGILVLLVSPATMWAQVAASISGKVEDVTGAAVGGATVTVREMATDAKRAATTDSAGIYHFLSLPVGVYELRAEKSGFEAQEWGGIRLNVGQEVVENLRLAVSGTVQEITVTETNPVVNTTTSSVSGLVGEEEIKDLPLNGRSFDALITLNPGTVNYSGLRSTNTTTSNGGAFAVDGQKPGDNETLLNGVEYGGASQLQVTPGGVSGLLLGVDAVREFNLETSTYGAEYGKRSGAQVNVVTQSGSNAVHGTLYEFLRNNVLDSRAYFDPASGAPPYKQNQFGAALGGPLKKDKLFLFGNYEGFRERLSATQIAFVPDNQARLGFLPCSTPGSSTAPACASGNAAGTPTKVANLNPAMLPYMAFWPSSPIEAGGGTAKFTSNPPQSINEDFGTARLDYILGPRDTLSGAYTIDRGTSLLPQPDPFFASALAVGSQVFSLQETHIFSPQVVNSATFGFSRASFADNSVPSAAFLAQPGVANLDFVPGRGPGGITIGGGNTTTGAGVVAGAGPSNNAGVFNHRNLFTYTDNVQISKGIHQISAGVWFQRLQDNEDIASRQLGVASFTGLQTFLQGTVQPNGFQIVTNPAELGWRTLMGAWYVQDAIRVRHNLTVQLGLRHEFDTGWNEAHDRAANFITDPATGILETTPRVGSSAFTQNNAKWLFGPRVALAWDPYGDGSTAVHAGFGIYYSMLDALAFQLNSVPGPNGENGTLSYSGSLPAILPRIGSPTSFAPFGVQQDAKTPTVEKWSLSIEQKLSNTISLRVGYVGSFGYHQIVSEDDNSIVPLVCSAAAAPCTAGGNLKASATVPSLVPAGTEYIPWGNGVPNTRPNPALANGFFWNTVGNSSYNALQVDVTKRFTRQLQFRANYTWSKSLDNNSAPTLAQSNNQAQMVLDRFNLRRDWGPSALNVAHEAHFTATYELPFGRGQRWLANVHGVQDKLVSGWVFNTITTLLSGFPLTPQVGSNISGDGDTRNPDRPVLNPSFVGPITVRNGTTWFNPAAYQSPTPGTYGTAALPIISRGSLTGPGYVEMDVSLFKDTQVTERVKVQFRTECFNVLNHTNFGTPNLLLTSPTAGKITTLAVPQGGRLIQFGLKVIY
jgi:Carboxypeptidase regulatory-like domain